ncbi:MAG: polysaccharide biosynthesis C-terminal domain-containing protein [Collinsella aerofaciens]
MLSSLDGCGEGAAVLAEPHLGFTREPALGIPLISRFGQNGAAVASVASEIAVNAPLLIYSVRVVKPKLNKRDITSSCCASGCLAISLVLVSHLFSGNLATVIADVVIGAAVYMLVCLAAKNTMLLELVEMLKEKGLAR